MKLKQPDQPVQTAVGPSADEWEALSNRLIPPSPNAIEPAGGNDDGSESPRLDNDRNLTASQLADSALDNVVKCTDCNKPVLQASLADHQAICPNSKNPSNLKRKLSEDSSNSQPPKKSKITLHFANSTTNSPDPTVPAPLAGTTTSTKPSPSPSASALPPPVSSSSTTPLPVPSPAGPPLVVVNGGPSAAGLDKKNKRVVDPDRQCGVINERGLPCQRSLTCKTHNMTAKRAVPHRSQPFDSLLLEWQKASRLGKEREALSKGLRDGGIGGTGVGPGGLPQGVANGMQGQMQIGGVPGGDESMSGGAGGGGGPASGKKEKRKKNANNLLTANGQLPPGLDAASLLQAQANGLSGGATMSTTSTTTGKKSKKPNANSLNSTSNGSNLQSIYYVGEAPPPPPTATTGGKPNEEEEEEESDYLSSSDEVESVLLSLQKLAKNRRIQPPSTGTGGSPLLMREGSGSGFSSASWWTGRNRKLMRLRGLGLDTVFGGGSQAGTGGGLNGGNAKR